MKNDYERHAASTGKVPAQVTHRLLFRTAMPLDGVCSSRCASPPDGVRPQKAAELRLAIRDLRTRGLYSSAQWAAQQLGGGRPPLHCMFLQGTHWLVLPVSGTPGLPGGSLPGIGRQRVHSHRAR